MVEIKKILCPVDFSEISPKVASYARDFAQALNADIIVLYVSPSIDQYPYFRLPPTNFQDFLNDHIVNAEQAMDAFIQEHLGSINASGKVLSGDTAEVILDAADLEDAGLIIMGTHGRKGFNRLIFGSVAEKVVKASSVPVLTVRPD